MAVWNKQRQRIRLGREDHGCGRKREYCHCAQKTLMLYPTIEIHPFLSKHDESKQHNRAGLGLHAQ